MKTQYLPSNPPLTLRHLYQAIELLSKTQPTGITLIAPYIWRKEAHLLQGKECETIQTLVVLPKSITHTTLWGVSDGETIIYSKGDSSPSTDQDPTEPQV
jgi:hypothetical protein